MHAASVNSELKRTKRVKWRFSLLAAAANVAYERRQQTKNERAAQAAAQARNSCNRVRTNMLQTKERERERVRQHRVRTGRRLGLSLEIKTKARMLLLLRHNEN